MMASNLISRLLPSVGSASIYEALDQHDHSPDVSDVEERAGMALDEENLGRAFQDYELDDVLDDGAESQVTSTSTAFQATANRDQALQASKGKGKAGPSSKSSRWMQASTRISGGDEADDDVPASLLIEEHARDPPLRPQTLGGANQRTTHFPMPGLATATARSHWEATQNQQPLHLEDQSSQRRDSTIPGRHAWNLLDPKEKALWRWANVENLDNFLNDVYNYFLGKGIWSILLSRLLNLLTFAFVVAFGFFLSMCIDYSAVPHSKSMKEVFRPKCTKNMSGITSLFIWFLTFFWLFKVVEYIRDLPRLVHLHDFYLHLLEIPDSDMQTVSWQEVVGQLMKLRDSNPFTSNKLTAKHRAFIGNQSKQRMDAIDIANRLMRRENYLIALFNKDILDLTLPIPFFRNRQLFSNSMEWNLHLCVLDFVFNEQGQVRPLFLKDSHRHELSEGFRRRFRFAGVMNLCCAPFMATYFLLLYFFRYFNEYQRNPSQIGIRQYTPLAEWKFREFNELRHLFERRVNMSYPFAARYVDQFPKDKTIQLSRFIALVAGALASVLAVASLLDPDVFLGFEITPERTVLFYLGVLGSIWAMARGVVPDDNIVFDPEFSIREVIQYTHYCPDHWRGRLHSDDIRREFTTLYQVKLVIFLEEIMSIILTPLVLWYSLPKCSDKLVDFFREFTVHVDGLGYVCSFAEFDFKAGRNRTTKISQDDNGIVEGLRDDYYSTKDGKEFASFFNFMDNYATNPKHGVPYMRPTAKRMFHLPPAFPGILSPTLGPENRTTAGGRPHASFSRAPLNAGAYGQQSAIHTSRFDPAGGHGSPMGSILLDPHHQPASSAFRTPTRAVQSRYKSARLPLDDPVEVDEEDETEHEADDGEGRASSSRETKPEVLGGSWKTTQAGAVEGDDDEAEDGNGKSRGVLGLIYDFQKAQNGTRATTVNI